MVRRLLAKIDDEAGLRRALPGPGIRHQTRLSEVWLMQKGKQPIGLLLSLEEGRAHDVKLASNATPLPIPARNAPCRST
jgi:hypothetical protein